MTAREVALHTLNQARTANAWANDLLEIESKRAKLSPVDRRFAMQLTLGVIRRRNTLDALLRPFIQRPFHEVEPILIDALRLGAYQLLFLSQVPKHAAVHETVQLAITMRKPKAKGFLNGVLRRVSELADDATTSNPSPTALPLDDGHYRKLNKPLLPDPKTEPANYLSTAFSWPRWLAVRWLERFDFDECVCLGFWFNAAPPLWIRINSLKTNREAYRLQLASQRIDSESGTHPQSLRLTESVSVRELPGYDDGEFTVHDHSSMQIATALHPQAGWKVLDLCAAPGGKTTHLAELMSNHGKIIACDIDPKRLDTVTTLCHRLGITIVETFKVDKFATEPPPGPFDAAIVDVPCSNTGVLGRRPEVRWRLATDDFEELIRLQTRLLFTAIERVKPGGVIVYSTCSIEPDENEGVIAAVRRGLPKLIVEAQHHAIPGEPSDGGYWARLRLPG